MNRSFCLAFTMLFVISGLFENYAQTIKVTALIIDKNRDTIPGIIKLPKYSETYGAIVLNNFDQIALTDKIIFKKDQEKTFQYLLPSSLNGFIFTYKCENYNYRTFELDYYNMFKGVIKEPKFLRCIHQGAVNLFQHTFCIQKTTGNSAPEGCDVNYEYYLYNDDFGLFKVDTGSIRKGLEHFKLKDEFIQNLPIDSKIRDLKRILEEYERWLPLHSN